MQLDQRLSRRNALALLAGTGVAIVAGCSSGDDTTSEVPSPSTSASATPSTATTQTAATISEPIPAETGGPFPGDGTNGPNVLVEDGVVRDDIRSSFGSASGVAEGVELTLNLTILDSSAGYAPYGGAAVYLWHCDREGRYSLYSQGVTGENYLRGVQEADADGRLTFTTIFPGAYSGRWPHIHFEVFPSLDAATSASSKVRTSQIALPEEACVQAYAADGYDQSVTNMTSTTLDEDNVFRDGYSLELATVTGDVENGFTASLTFAV